MANLIIAGMKWIAPHGIARHYARKREMLEVQWQSERQQRLFRQFVPAGTVAFDVGANVGNRITALLNCGAKVVAVEPQPDCVARLRSSYPENVTVVQAAVGMEAGRLPLHISAPLDTVASLSPMFITKVQESQRFGDRDWTRTIVVEVITLDSLVSQYGQPSFIKIDVEGFEYEALCGLTQGVDVLSFEWTSDMPDRAKQCIDYLVGLGSGFFQFSFGESMLLSHRASLDAPNAKRLVDMLGEETALWGDIYASRRPLVRAQR